MCPYGSIFGFTMTSVGGLVPFFVYVHREGGVSFFLFRRIFGTVFFASVPLTVVSVLLL